MKVLYSVKFSKYPFRLIPLSISQKRRRGDGSQRFHSYSLFSGTRFLGAKMKYFWFGKKFYCYSSGYLKNHRWDRIDFELLTELNLCVFSCNAKRTGLVLGCIYVTFPWKSTMDINSQHIRKNYFMKCTAFLCEIVKKLKHHSINFYALYHSQSWTLCTQKHS